MAKVSEITGEQIERFRGILDFYLYKGKIPVVRKWPRKITPPYTSLQAEAMAVFSILAKSESRITGVIYEAWKVIQEGARSQWSDTYKGIGMKYWKIHRSIPGIALDYEVIDDGLNIKVKWDVLQLFIDPLIPEEITEIITGLIVKADIEKVIRPIYFTLLSDTGERLIAPYIKYLE
jgi:hypothetical protein